MKNENLCTLVRELLTDYSAGVLSPEVERLIVGHIEKCTDCKCHYSRQNHDPLPEPEACEPDIEHFVKKHNHRKRLLKLAAALVGCAAIFFASVSGYMYLMTPKIESIGTDRMPGVLLSNESAQSVTVKLTAQYTRLLLPSAEFTPDFTFHTLSVASDRGQLISFSESEEYFLNKLPIDARTIHSPIVSVNKNNFNDTIFHGTFFADAQSQCAILICPDSRILVFPADSAEKARELVAEFGDKFGFDDRKILCEYRRNDR